MKILGMLFLAVVKVFKIAKEKEMTKIEKAKEVVVIGAILHSYLKGAAEKYWVEMHEQNIMGTYGLTVFPIFTEFEQMTHLLEQKLGFVFDNLAKDQNEVSKLFGIYEQLIVEYYTEQ